MATECPLCGNEYERVGSHISYSHTEEEHKSLLIEELQRLANECEKTPPSSLMGSEGEFGEDIYYKKFGSWNEALKEAGFEINMETDVGKEKLLNELQRLADEYEKTPTKKLMNSEGKFSGNTYKRTFGSWNEALKEAGFEINHENNISKDRLLEEIQRLADEYEKTPTIPLIKSKGKFAASTYHRIFGSWNEALKEAGLEINQENNISKDRLLEELQRLDNEYEKTPTISLVDSKGKFGVTTYQNVFGSWNNALRESGLEVNVNTDFDKEDLLNELQRLYDEYDRTPTSELMNAEGKFAENNYYRSFGSWNNALREAGLEVNMNTDFDKEELLEEIQRLYDKYEKAPTKRLMDSKGKFAESTYSRSFGSWNEALKEAGLEVNINTDFDKEELLEEIQRLANDCNRTPTVQLMKSKGKFSEKVYRKNFGSWNEALKEAGLEVNNSSMCGMEQSVYVLECENNKYYVGASSRPDKRLREHKNQGRNASSWVREHGVKERVYLSDPMPHEKAYQKEREKTLELMRKYGWENVRGSCWFSVELESPPEPLKMNRKI